MTNELLFDFIALRLNHEKTDGMKAVISMVFSDSNEVWALELSNSVLNNTRGRVLKNPDVTITLTRPAFLAMLLQARSCPNWCRPASSRSKAIRRASVRWLPTS
jgi:alkyl sulfatase BDS1-like metallo-beta-lactamase superfamily hydrolase